jgi:TonB family protein
VLSVAWGLAFAQKSEFQAGTVQLAQSSALPSAAASVSAATTHVYRFNIASQPLAAALDQYGTTSGRPVFFDAAVVAGRVSTAIQGDFSPEAALRSLLDGTGLTAEFAEMGGTGAFALKTLNSPSAIASPETNASAASVARLNPYNGAVQARIRDAFCQIPLIEPSDYQTAVSFNIDPAGRVTDVHLLHSTGDRDRDAAVQVTLQHIQLDQPPPPDLAQPFYMVILPRNATPGLDCRSRP